MSASKFEEKLDVFRSHVKSVEKEAGVLSMIEVAESGRKCESQILLLMALHVNLP